MRADSMGHYMSDVEGITNQPKPAGLYYSAFLDLDRGHGVRTPIPGAERIVIVLGTDEKTGLPLELSVSLRRQEDRSVHVYAIREPPPTTRPLVPELIVEEVPAINLRKVSVRYDT